MSVQEDGSRLTFEEELENLINRHSQENASNTPDYILASYLSNCLDAFNQATYKRELHYNRIVTNLPGLEGKEIIDSKPQMVKQIL